jgi:oxygen-independent coproporphyrinogen III oxidase
MLSLDLLEKYNTRGPRYTSYPTAPVWQETFGPEDYKNALVSTNLPPSDPLSLYVHIPFCESRCLYCSCNIIVTNKRDQAEKYLNSLFQEIEQVAALTHSSRRVVQFHWGGGTPTYLTPEQMERLFQFQKDHFQFAEQAEIAIEIDPRVTASEQLHLLKALGFNRVSLGVQDFNAKVQETVNRVQPVDMTASMVDECRSLGFESVNFDLIYGLPFQTVETFRQTLKEVIQISPDRIALYNYAHVPWMSPYQKQLPEAELPSGSEKFQIFQLAMQLLTDTGYVYIGMDHFAKPEDSLSVALKSGTLHRNFMGYTVKNQSEQPHGDTELYGFGVSAISSLNRCYAQNHKKLSTYDEAVKKRILPTHRGIMLSDEDMLRRKVILGILCQGEVDFAAFESDFPIRFKAHFADALQQLAGPTEDGLLTWTERGFQLTALGRIFSRNIAMAFDAYLSTQTQSEKQPMFSKTL